MIQSYVLFSIHGDSGTSSKRSSRTFPTPTRYGKTFKLFRYKIHNLSCSVEISTDTLLTEISKLFIESVKNIFCLNNCVYLILRYYKFINSRKHFMIPHMMIWARCIWHFCLKLWFDFLILFTTLF